MGTQVLVSSAKYCINWGYAFFFMISNWQLWSLGLAYNCLCILGLRQMPSQKTKSFALKVKPSHCYSVWVTKSQSNLVQVCCTKSVKMVPRSTTGTLRYKDWQVLANKLLLGYSIQQHSSPIELLVWQHIQIRIQHNVSAPLVHTMHAIAPEWRRSPFFNHSSEVLSPPWVHLDHPLPLDVRKLTTEDHGRTCSLD